LRPSAPSINGVGELQGKRVEIANEMIVADGTDEAYEAFCRLFAQTAVRPAGP